MFAPHNDYSAWRPVRWRELAWLCAVNSALTAIGLALAYLPSAKEGLTGIALWSVPSALISQGFFINSAATLIIAAFYGWMPNRVVCRTVAWVLYGLTQIAVVADMVVFHS